MYIFDFVLFKFVLRILEAKYAQSSDPEVKRCIVKVISEFNKAEPAAANEDNPTESPPPPKSEAPIEEIYAVRKVTTAEYQTRLLEYKVCDPTVLHCGYLKEKHLLFLRVT